jgi:hypothetical protein
MRLLDSDTLTHLFEGHPRAAKRLQATQDAVGTTVVSWIEVLQGRFDFLLKAANGEEVLRAQQLLDRTREFLARLDVRPWDDRAVGIFEQLRKMKGLKKIGRAGPADREHRPRAPSHPGDAEYAPLRAGPGP